jgi:signal transduction histidine kinase
MTMKFKSPLSQRIILSFVLLTGIVSGLFTLGFTATIHYVEKNLVTTELHKDFTRIVREYKNGHDLSLDEGSAFFIAGPELPDYLREVKTGYTEIVLEHRAYYVFHDREGNISYFLVKDQTAFEKAEILLLRAVFGGAILSSLVAFIIGLFMVKKVIEPVRRLTRQVIDRKDMRKELPPFFPDYANDELGALAQAFDTTISELQQALQREALFTSDVSHELRTPLMVINSTCELLMAKEDLDDYNRGRIAAIDTAANEIKGLVEAFLILARGRDRQPETAPLETIAGSEMERWTQLAAQKGNRLRLHGEKDNGRRTDSEYPAILLRTVLDNLIRNAIHHTVGGEIVLTLGPDGFDVRDTGSGIAKNEQAHVFKPYYRGMQSHRSGLGLGLSLVQRICDREGWTVLLEENHPKGCCFRINLR